MIKKPATQAKAEKTAAKKAKAKACESPRPARTREATARPTGRPTLYSGALAEQICERLIEGESLRKICSPENMPDRNTVFRWLEAHPSFATKYARAREMQGDTMDDLILETAKACTNETAAADRVKIAAYQWRASKLKPKKYGDRITSEITGPDGGPVEIQAVSAIRERIAEKLNRIALAAAKGEPQSVTIDGNPE